MKQLWDTPPHLRQADPAREAALAEALTAVVKEIPDWDKSVVRLLKVRLALGSCAVVWWRSGSQAEVVAMGK